MDEVYKGHGIHASAWHLLDTNEWHPRVTVTWTEPNGKESIANPNTTRTFCTQGEAEREALLFAKKWIDRSRPPFPAQPTLRDKDRQKGSMTYCKCDIADHNHPNEQCDKPAVTHDGYCDYCVADIAIRAQPKLPDLPPRSGG